MKYKSYQDKQISQMSDKFLPSNTADVALLELMKEDQQERTHQVGSYEADPSRNFIHNKPTSNQDIQSHQSIENRGSRGAVESEKIRSPPANPMSPRLLSPTSLVANGSRVQSSPFIRQVVAGGHQTPIIREKYERIMTDNPVNRQSRIQYVPFQRKVIEYEINSRTEKVPKVRKVVEYREQVREEFVPREVTKNDYYAIEYRKDYVAQQIPEKTVRMVEKAVPYTRIEYVPVTRQVIHYHNGNEQGAAPANVQPVQQIPQFYQNYPGNFFNAPLPQQTLNSPQPYQTSPSRLSQNAGNTRYSVGIEELNKHSSQLSRNRFKLSKNFDLYDHYETYIPSFRY